MKAFSVTASDLFDGLRWRGPCTVQVKDGIIREITPPVAGADMAVRTVIPGLVDYGVSVSGYLERSDDEHPFAPEEAFGLLCLRYGVTTVVDLANDWSTIEYLKSSRFTRLFPRMIYGGARLCASPRSRHDVIVSTSNCERIIKGQLAWGASFFSLGEFRDPALVDRVVRLARELKQPLAWSGPEHERSGCFWTWPHVTPFGAWLQDVAVLAEVAAYFAPQLEAGHRWTIDGLLEADFAHLAAPVTPYARNFIRMSGFVGRRVGRKMLENRYGQRDAALPQVDLEQTARSFAKHNACLAASGAVRAGVVPGLSLWHEMARLGTLHKDNEKALLAAGAAGAGLWPELGLGRIEPGRRADFLLLDQTWDKGSIWQLLKNLRTVIAGGDLYEIELLDQKLRVLVDEALKEAV